MIRYIAFLSLLSFSFANYAQNTASSASFVSPAEVVSQQDITIGPPNIRRMWNYKIEYLIPENTQVEKGELLIRFDAQRQRRDLVDYKSRLQTKIEQKQQTLLEDNATERKLILAVAEAIKDRDIAKQKVDIVDVSRSDIEKRKQLAELNIASTLLHNAEQKLEHHQHTAKVNLNVRDVRIAKENARVKRTETAIERLSIYAPAEGIVNYIAQANNSRPAEGDSIYLGRTLIKLPSLDKLAIKVEIVESSFAQIKQNQTVSVVLDDHPEKAYTGTLSRIGRAFRAKSQWDEKVVIDAWITLDTPDKTVMRPGMKANVEFM